MTVFWGWSPVWLTLVLLVAALLTWWSYRRTQPLVSLSKRILLSVLRFTALAFILVLLFDPVIQRLTQHRTPPVLALLIDGSSSIAAADSLQAHEDIRNIIQYLNEFDGQLEIRQFDSALDTRTLSADSISFTGSRTDISRALLDLEESFQGENLRSVILVSDGLFNAGRNPLYVAERYPFPIHTVTVGDTTVQDDIRIEDVLTNEIAYSGTELPIRVSVHSEGFAGREATVSVSEAGQTLAQERITLPDDGLVVTTELRITPEEEGLRRYTISVTRFEGEATHANNTTGVTVRVLDSRRRILVLAAAPGPDLASLRRELEDAPDIELILRTPLPDGSFYEGNFPSDLTDIDLIVLAGFPGRASTSQQIQALAEAAERIPVLFLLSRQTALNQWSSALSDILPVRPEVVRAGYTETHLLPASSAHPVMSIPGITPAALNRLPPVYSSDSRWAASPDARVLATAGIRGVNVGSPMLVIRQRGSTRSAALLASGTWRWQNLPPDLQDLEPFYPGLIENLVRWLTAAEDQRPVRIRPTETFFDVTERIRFTGQVYNESMEPVTNAEVRLSVTTPEGNALPFTMRPVGNGRYELDAGILPEGTYSFSGEATLAELSLGTDRGSFQVGAHDLELRNLRANAALMNEVARRSGGLSTFPTEISRLSAALADDLIDRPSTITRESNLRDIGILLAIIIVLLTAEWVMRKRVGML